MKWEKRNDKLYIKLFCYYYNFKFLDFFFIKVKIGYLRFKIWGLIDDILY